MEPGMYEQPIDQISHVVYCVRPENFDRVAEYWAKRFDIVFDDISEPRLGLKIRLSLPAGIEIITPDASLGTVVSRVAEFLETNGEGIYSLVYGVPDMDESPGVITPKALH
jgi:hypothetical protein